MRRELSREAAKYSLVGSAGYLIDVTIFNILALAERIFYVDENPLINKVISAGLAIAFTYVANSRWTFKLRQARGEGLNRIVRYAIVNLVGLSISVFCLWVSRYVLGFDNLVADNISANVIGTALALVFRFFANRAWVFTK